jgi:hypothetical protein
MARQVAWSFSRQVISTDQLEIGLTSQLQSYSDLMTCEKFGNGHPSAIGRLDFYESQLALPC